MKKNIFSIRAVRRNQDPERNCPPGSTSGPRFKFNIAMMIQKKFHRCFRHALAAQVCINSGKTALNCRRINRTAEVTLARHGTENVRGGIRASIPHRPADRLENPERRRSNFSVTAFQQSLLPFAFRGGIGNNPAADSRFNTRSANRQRADRDIQTERFSGAKHSDTACIDTARTLFVPADDFHCPHLRSACN